MSLRLPNQDFLSSVVKVENKRLCYADLVGPRHTRIERVL